ncbi:MAG: metallophosphoesterase [Oscillospiraceae bacterium]|nr:metallophosphoesterase [Oscillospiraceae bacterium]
MKSRKTLALLLIMTMLSVSTLFACSSDRGAAQNHAASDYVAAEEISDTIPDLTEQEGTPEPRITREDFQGFKLTILHTNDLHGRLENVAQYYTIIEQVRQDEPNVLLLDGGDLYRRGPYEHLNGAVEVEIMNAMGYEAVAFGNNEFPFNDEELYDLSEHTILKNAEFPVLLGNVTLDGEYIEGTEPYIILEYDINGEPVKIAVIGVTSMKPLDRDFDITKRVVFSEPDKALDALTEKTKPLSDIQIALSHAGLDTDLLMRGVSAIVGADTHTKLESPMVITDGDRLIPVVQAGGELDNYLGRLELYFEQADGEWVLVDFDGYLYSLEGVEANPEILAILEKYADEYHDPADIEYSIMNTYEDAA